VTTTTSVFKSRNPRRRRRSETRHAIRMIANPSGKAPKPTRATVTPPGELNAIPTGPSAAAGSTMFLDAIARKRTEATSSRARLNQTV